MKSYLTLIMINIALTLPCGLAQSIEHPTPAGSIPETKVSSQAQQMPGYPIKIEQSEGWSIRGTVLADINGDEALEVVHSYSDCEEWDRCERGVVAAWDYQGVEVPGFPVFTIGGAFNAPSVGDMDGDGDQEIVQITMDVNYSARLYVLDHQGALLPGFPVAIGTASIGDGASLHDLDLDGTMEIIYCSEKAIHVFEIDGSQWSNGWPVAFDEHLAGTPAIGDVDLDGVPDIFIAESGCRLHLLKPDASEHTGWPRAVREELFFDLTSSAALADIDGDLDLEIIVAGVIHMGTRGPAEVHIFHHDGIPMTGWPQTTNNKTGFCTPVVTDLEGDGSPEILFGGSLASTHRAIIYAWDASGTIKPGFPYLSEHAHFPGEISMITVADANGDGSMEIFADSTMAGYAYQQQVPVCDWCGYLYGVDAQGRDLPGFPLRPFGELAMSGVNIGDVDGDGDYELAVAARDILHDDMYVHLYDLTSSYAKSDFDWLTFHAANSRGGLQKRQYTGWRFVYTGSRRGGGR
jgi:hypothetical protein